MTFVDECVLALGGNSRIISVQEENDLIDQIESRYPFNSWGRIIWDDVTNKFITSIDRIYDELCQLRLIEEFGSSVYVIWNAGSLPSVLSDIEQVTQVMDYVIMGYDTFLYAASGGFIVEIYHEGEVTIGW